MACAPRVEGILSEIPGVESAKVDYDTKTATIECTSAVSADAIADVVGKSGQYSVELQN